MNGIAVILHSVKHPSNNVKYPGISDTFHVKMMALKQLQKFTTALDSTSPMYAHENNEILDDPLTVTSSYFIL